MQRRRRQERRKQRWMDSVKDDLREKGLSDKETPDGCLEATGQNH